MDYVSNTHYRALNERLILIHPIYFPPLTSFRGCVNCPSFKADTAKALTMLFRFFCTGYHRMCSVSCHHWHIARTTVASVRHFCKAFFFFCNIFYKDSYNINKLIATGFFLFYSLTLLLENTLRHVKPEDARPRQRQALLSRAVARSYPFLLTE